jgi:hypothetical protein
VAAGPGAIASIGAAEAAGVHVMVLGTFGMGVYALAKPIRRRHRESNLTINVGRVSSFAFGEVGADSCEDRLRGSVGE